MRSRFSPRGQVGAITAEFAVVLPAVLLVTATLISGMAAGATKVKAAHAAATMARAYSRGEPIAPLAKQFGVTAQTENTEDFVCVRAIVPLPLVQIDEKSCARKLGL